MTIGDKLKHVCQQRHWRQQDLTTCSGVRSCQMLAQAIQTSSDALVHLVDADPGPMLDRLRREIRLCTLLHMPSAIDPYGGPRNHASPPETM
jgi:hypothetical protein